VEKRLPGQDESLAHLRMQMESESRDSAALFNNPAENPICCITFDECLRSVLVVWKQYATHTQIQFVHENILRLTQEHGASRILGDDTALPTIASEDRAWIVENWMPRAVAAGLRFVASKKPDAYFGRLSVAGIQSGAPAGLMMRSFDDLQSARDWLQTTGGC
jgi:hypothetical protein